MKRTSGFALIMSLLALAVIAALGVGAMFLTQMNLKIAENSRTQAIAHYNAEAGLETSFVVLAGTYKQDSEVPADATAFLAAFPGFETDRYTLNPTDGYTLFGDGSVRVSIIGHGPRNARYEAEALVKPVLSPSTGPTDYTIFGEGFVAKDGITINGNGTFDTNFISGGDIKLGGTLLKGRTASAAGTKCSTKNSEAICLTNQPPPDVPLPVFDTLRTQVIDNAAANISGFDIASCPMVTGSYSASSKVVCVPSGSSLTITGNVHDLIVIGDATTTINMNAVAGSSTDDSVDGVTIVSGTVSFGSGSAFYGTNSIFAKSDISFGKNIISRDDTARTMIATEGDFVLNGAGTSNIYATFWVGGALTINGTGDVFKATVVANETIIKNGAGSFSTISSPKHLDNDYIPVDPDPTYTGAGIRVLSRR